MAMTISTADSDDDGDLNTTINTTPLVDVMLVLLIIFLITIPVVTHTVKMQLPQERNIATVTKPQNIVIEIDQDGNIYWQQKKIDFDELQKRVAARAPEKPQPEVHIRADQNALYKYVGRVVFTVQQGGIQKVAFITQPKGRVAAQ